MDTAQQPLVPEKVRGGEALCHLAYSWKGCRKNVAYDWHLLEAETLAGLSNGWFDELRVSPRNKSYARCRRRNRVQSRRGVGETKGWAARSYGRRGYGTTVSSPFGVPAPIVGLGDAKLLPLI